MFLPFHKMHGAGNDFIVLDARASDVSWFLNNPAHIKTLCDRRFGIGCDQLIVIAQSPTATAAMHIYNQDASVAGMCGNATRCVTKLLCEDLGVNAITLQVGARVLQGSREANGLYTTNMGAADFAWQHVPLASASNTLELELGIEGLPLAAACSMGNPHCVLVVDDAAAIPLETLGPQLETHPIFPQKANISFVSAQEPNVYMLRVWERGVGPTLACGSAACAAFAVLNAKGLVGQAATIKMPGGDLNMAFNAQGHILMTGPAVLVASGVAEIVQAM